MNDHLPLCDKHPAGSSQYLRTLISMASVSGLVRAAGQAFSLAVLMLLTLISTPAVATDFPRFSYLETSQSKGAQEAMVVKTGSWWVRRHLTHGALLIEHPQGTYLFDTGLGREVESQFEENGWLSRQVFAFTSADPVVDQLERNNYRKEDIRAIIPSHLHWDHASGLVDFPDIPVWVQQRELDAALAGTPPSFLRSQLDDQRIQWHPINLNDTPFMGFSRSLDIHGDGTMVLVDLSGHTAGQVGLFLRTSPTQEYLFIGDTTWVIRGVEDNQPRPGLLKLVVDLEHDKPESDQRISQVHELQLQKPGLVIVPAHDERIAATLPRFPRFSGD